MPFLVFARADRHPWELYQDQNEPGTLHMAVSIARVAVTAGSFDRAVVMEVSGVDAFPTFTYRHGEKRSGGVK